MNKVSLAVMAALALCLAGCGSETDSAAYRGDEALPNGMTVKQQIEARQHNLKDLGGAFKTVNDQLKTGAPQLEQIRLAAQEIKSHAGEIANWFPAGTGPDAGVKTEALATIWSDNAAFTAAAANLNEQAAKLSDVSTTDDIEGIKAQAAETGKACKACHEKFRMKKD